MALKKGKKSKVPTSQDVKENGVEDASSSDRATSSKMPDKVSEPPHLKTEITEEDNDSLVTNNNDAVNSNEGGPSLSNDLRENAIDNNVSVSEENTPRKYAGPKYSKPKTESDELPLDNHNAGELKKSKKPVKEKSRKKKQKKVQQSETDITITDAVDADTTIPDPVAKEESDEKGRRNKEESQEVLNMTLDFPMIGPVTIGVQEVHGETPTNRGDTPAKKKRGRPPGSKNKPKDPNAPPKKPKVLAPGETPRKRGRPPKSPRVTPDVGTVVKMETTDPGIVIEAESESQPSCSVDTTPRPRKRGRPPKNSTVETLKQVRKNSENKENESARKAGSSRKRKPSLKMLDQDADLEIDQQVDEPCVVGVSEESKVKWKEKVKKMKEGEDPFNPDEVYEFVDENEPSLKDTMKGVIVDKVNNLIDQTMTSVEKCNCCGVDINFAHRPVGQYKCNLCTKSFKLKTSLERHKKIVHLEGDSYECPECGSRCADKGTLARHMYTHTGLKPYHCESCNKDFTRKYHLDRHIMQRGCDGNPRPAHPCQVCGKMFSRKDNLREHLRAHAGQVKRKKKFTCSFCQKEFHGVSLLQIHIRTHTGERPFQCEFCDKTFPSNGAMKKHTRVHTGERPYECKECTMRFAAKETLNRHVRTHTGIRPHICQYCGKSFIQPSQLRAHVFHHTGEFGFSCKVCSKSFNRKARLMLHVKYVHEGAKPFECSDCKKTFVRKEDLHRHSITHTGVKPHKCPVCNKGFAIKPSLKLHLLTHTKRITHPLPDFKGALPEFHMRDGPKSCDLCGRAFINQECLMRHMRKKHKESVENYGIETEKPKMQPQEMLVSGLKPEPTDNVPTLSAMSQSALAESIKELLLLLVDEATLRGFGYPETAADELLECVIKRCGHQPASRADYEYCDRLRENAKLLFTVVIDDSAVKTLLSHQSVDEVILHVLQLAKS